MARQQQAQRIAQQQRQTQSVQQEQNARQAAYQAANQKRNGALATDPKKTEPPKFKYEENQAAYGGLNERQQSRYNAILRNKGRAAANKFLQTASGGQVVMPGGKRMGEAVQAGPTPESVTEQGFMGAGEMYQGMLDRFQGSDPYQMGQMYQPAFGQEMDRYRQNVMDQFNRRNAEEFQRQDLATQQQIAERGLDPNSPAAQALMKANTQRQDLARQEAMSAAETGAYGIQEQAFGQAYKTAMAPYEQFGVLQQPYIAGIQAQYTAQENQLQRQFDEAMRRGDRASAERIARMSRSGGGGGQAGPSLYERMEAANLGQGAGQQQPNPWAGAASGFAQGVGAGIARGLTS